MIKGIIFDLDGVYFKNGTESFLNNVASIYGVERAKVLDVYLKSENMQKYKRNELTSREYWGWFVSELGIEATPEELFELLVKGYERNDKAVSLMKKVKKEGIKTIICSNNFKERIELLEKKFNFRKDFDFIILSFIHGIVKPDLLNIVLDETGFRSEEILVIDDGDTIIKEADKLGFKTILCQDPNRLALYLEEMNIKF